MKQSIKFFGYPLSQVAGILLVILGTFNGFFYPLSIIGIFGYVAVGIGVLFFQQGRLQNRIEFLEQELIVKKGEQK